MCGSDPPSAPSGVAAASAPADGGGDARRRLPAVGELIAQPAVASLVEVYGRDLVLVHLRARLDALRARGAAA
ncbi:MAG TPA: hypothetical protein VMV46_18600, partial [Thermoanaerobaculia bacterium]|nr:hypothetical protein [Thermoanaerobaculia bacterium]